MRLTLLWLAVLLSASAIAEEPSAARAARFYAEGLDRPLMQLRTGLQLAQACVDRLERDCGEENRRLAAGGHIITLLNALTLFPQRPASDPVAGIRRARAIPARLGESRAALLRDTAEYDLALFARYGATMQVCPQEEDADEYLESLAALVDVNLNGYQALDAATAAEAVAELARQQAKLAERLRAGEIEECVAARTLGEDLMRLMDSKLQPWNVRHDEDPRQEFDFNQPARAKKQEAVKKSSDRAMAEAVTRNFVAVVATELQLTAFPETAARIKEIADQGGFPTHD